MNIFVTGGTGFVGSHFLRAACAAGHTIVALRRPDSSPRFALDVDPSWVEGPMDGDYSRYLGGVDVFVHLASHTPNPPYAPLHECLYWNVYAPLNLARQAHDSGVRHFLIAGSCFEYGRAAARLHTVSTATPLEPEHSYATSKAAASVAFAGLAREQHLRLKILRIFQVYGEGERETRFWPSLRRAALNGEDFKMSPGEQLRDFVPVESVATQLVDHLDFSKSVPGTPTVHHICSGQHQSLLSFAEYWWRRWDATGRLIPGAVPYRQDEIMKLVPESDSGR